MPEDAPPQRATHDPAEGRLDSWKEIAAYLRRDVKTVQRWERREGLPVHRLHHDKLGSVFAYRQEIDAWVAGRHHAPNGSHGRPPDGWAAGGEAVGERPAAAPSWRWGSDLRALSAAVGVVGLVALVWTTARPGTAPEPGRVARLVFHVEPSPGTVFSGTLIDPEPTISPDGTRIVFRAAERDTGRQRLYLRSLDRPRAEALPGTDGAMQAFWSPDSRQAAFFAGGALRRIDLTSRVVTVLARAPHPQGGAWLASGDIVFSPDDGEGIHVLPSGGGAPSALTVVDRAAREVRHVAPQPVPDGRGFIFLAAHADPARNAIWWWSGEPGDPRRVVTSRRMGRFDGKGWLLVFRDERLVAHRFETHAGALVGAPRELGERLEGDDANSLHPGLSVSSTGVIAYWPVTRTPLGRLTWFDRDGRELGTVGPPGDYPFVSLAPDASQAAVQRLDETTGAPDLWLVDLSSGRTTRLTASPVNEEDPVWSPDGSRILFAKHPAIGAEARLRHLRPTHPLDEGVGEPDVEGHPTDWSRDGRLVVVQRATPDTGSDLAVHRVSGGPPLAVLDSAFNERHGRLSPDGRLLAYSSDVSGRFEVYVRSLERDADTVQVSRAGGAHPRWRRDGRELYYLSAAGVLMAVPAATRPRISAGRPVPLFDARPPLPLPFLDTLYDVTPDGQRFLVAAADQSVTRSFTVVVEALAQLR